MIRPGAWLARRFAALSRAAEDVLAERRRHVDALAWSAEHDDARAAGELAMAAAAYALNARFRSQGVHHYAPPACWPWSTRWWRPRNFRRDLVKAAALLLAEIERFDRLAAYGRHGARAYVNEPERIEILHRFYGAQQ